MNCIQARLAYVICPGASAVQTICGTASASEW